MALRTTSLYYTFELAIPWTELGRDKAPQGNSMTCNIQVANGDGTSQVVESIADATPNGTYTWMPMHFHPNEQELTVRPLLEHESEDLRLVGNHGDYRLYSSREFSYVRILDSEGRSLMSVPGCSGNVRLPFLLPGIYIVQVCFMDGSALSRKLCINP